MCVTMTETQTIDDGQKVALQKRANIEKTNQTNKKPGLLRLFKLDLTTWWLKTGVNERVVQNIRYLLNEKKKDIY